MTNLPKNKGTSAESMFASYLRENGWPWAERRALAGSTDKGDISGCPGLVWEVKATSGRIRMGEWIQETIDEQANANADHGVLVVKYRGIGERNMDKWIAAMRAPEFRRLASNIWYLNSENGMYIPIDENSSINLRVDGPAGFNNQIIMQLSAFAITISREDKVQGTSNIPVMIRKPPGTSDDADAWYYITYLKHIVTLLRLAGYGNPLGDHDSETDSK